MDKTDKIYIAGHTGLVGAATARILRARGYNNLAFRGYPELDLTGQKAVFDFFQAEKPAYVVLAAAKVGGIHANNTYPADFIRDNLAIQTNVLEAARQAKVKRLVFLGSSCIYPKHAPQPLKEEYLLTGPLEPTNEPYAIAKIAGIKMCQAYNKQYGTDFVPVMPTNLYGPGDNFNLENSHVVPALIRKIHAAKISGSAKAEIWGTGRPRREFLYVDDAAEAIALLLEKPGYNELINIGCGQDIEIRELAEMIKEITGFAGELVFDAAKPDGTPRKLLDVSKISALGWKAKTPLKDGLKATYAWFIENSGRLRN